jgi:hypothetical protein
MVRHFERTELRVELGHDELAVLDGYCSATGQDRTSVVRRVLHEWSERKLHEAMVIVRVSGRNPTMPEPDRRGVA